MFEWHPHTLINTQTHVLLEASFCWMNSTSSLLFTLFSVPAPLTSRVFTCSSEVPDTLQYTDYLMKTMHNAQFSVPAPFSSRVLTCSSEVPDTLQYPDYLMKTMHKALFFCACTFDIQGHASSIAFRHLSPNSARIGYATEGALLSPCSCPRMRSEPSERVGY